LDGNVHADQFDVLLSDGKRGKQVEFDVELSESGPINLTLNNRELVFKVCESCMGTSTVCYESEIGLIDSGAAGTCFESSCKIEIVGNAEKIMYCEAPFYKKLFAGCLTSAMHFEFAKAKSSGESYNIKNDIKSCRPKIVGADKMVKLFVNIEDGCPVTVMNAKIHAPPTTTASPTKMPPQIQSSLKGSAEASSFPDWGYAV
uniref:Uncharacterized protein n=1 Tax=Panagrolaimus sp. PS1159 TaxID=55785 RepID=A0AC35G9B5_9BILA